MAKKQSALSWINWADMPGVTFTPSAEISTLPATNLADPEINQVWGVSGLSGGNTDFYVDVDLLGEREIGVVGLVLGWRLDRPVKLLDTPMMAATDLIRTTIDGSAGTFGAGAVADQGAGVECGVDPGIGYSVWPLPTAVNGQKVRVYLDAISRATAGYWWGARLWIGPLHRFLRGHQYGHTEKWDLNTFDETVRTPQIPFQFVKGSELGELKQFEQLTNTKYEMLFVEDVNDPHTSSVIGKREATTGLQSSFFQNYGFTFSQKETW